MPDRSGRGQFGHGDCEPIRDFATSCQAGDVTSALFLAHLLKGVRPDEALSRTTSSAYAVLEETHRARAREIRLVAAQDAIADPPDWFHARRVR